MVVTADAWTKDKYLLVAAHFTEAKALARSLSRCSRGPYPFTYSNPHFCVLVSGEGREKIVQKLEDMNGMTFRAAVLFGTAGALVDAIALGQYFICTSVTRSSRSVLLSTLPLDLPPAALYTSDSPIVDASRRKEISTSTGATLVDMEGFPFGHYFTHRGIPWAIVRVVSDTPQMPLMYPFPDSVMHDMKHAASRILKLLT